ncbi:MAG: MarC family protein [Gammaproteobacteria bacterium]|nr:MarC family protein [Gammaproteobacteria bacterium]
MSLFSLTLIFIILMDPLGNIPVFLALLKGTPHNRRVKIIIRECIIAFVILIVFLFFGSPIMRELQITPPALDIAGGVILFLVSLRMIFPPEHFEKITDKPVVEPFIVPLAIPMVAGPSTMAMVLLFSTQHPQNLWTCFFGLSLATLTTTIILVFAAKLHRILGERAIIAMERLMGMLLTVVAVQMLLNGVSLYFHLT